MGRYNTWDNPVPTDLFPIFVDFPIILGPGGCVDALQVNWTYHGIYNYLQFACLDEVRIYSPHPNNPPDAPIISGPESGRAGIDYYYNVTGTDPDGDDLYNYMIDWGDGNISGTAGAVPSGTTFQFNHTWGKEGIYVVRARVVDIYEASSNWSYLEVTMPKNKQSHNIWFLQWFERFPILQKIMDVLRLNN